MLSRKEKFLEEISFAKAASDVDVVRYHLGRAHVLSQFSVSLHLKVHWLMFKFAIREADFSEILGQLIRLIVTAPGHLNGKVPRGNIGWSTVGLTQKMDIPADLKPYFE